MGHEKKSGRRKKLSARKDVQDLINDMDPASCVTPVQTAVVPEVILRLNDEYKDLFQSALPQGLHHSRPNDHRIDFQQKYKIQAPRLYRLAPSDD